MKLSVIIVNWNSFSYLRKCVASLATHMLTEYEVIVVDNASPGEDADLIQRELPEVKLIRCEKNLGFGGANNLGFRHSRGEYILFLNPDTELLNSAADLMIEAMSSCPDAGIMGCTLFNEDTSVQTSCVQTFPTILNQLLDSDWLRERRPNSRLWGTRALWSECREPQRVEAISGACMLTARPVVESVGGFTEDYFMYAEDLDLCYKVQKAGYSNYFLKDGTVLHYGGKSSDPERGTRMKWQAIVKFCEKHYGRGYALAFRCAIACGATVRLIMIAGVRAFKSVVLSMQPNPKALAKWKIILKTMLAS